MKSRSGRFSKKGKASKSNETIQLETNAPKRRNVISLEDEHWQERATEAEYRLQQVHGWLENMQDKAGLDTQTVIISRTDLLLLRGILDDVVDLDDLEGNEEDHDAD